MKILAGLLFLLGMNAYGAQVNLGCVTEEPTTTIIAETKNNVVNFLMYHHHGVQYMPIHDGIITPNDLKLMSARAKVLSDLGNKLSFDMSADNCQVDEELYDCFGKTEVQVINGHKVHLWAAYSKLDDEKSFAGKFSYVTVNFALEVDGQDYFVPMKYFSNECYKDSFDKKLFLK